MNQPRTALHLDYLDGLRALAVSLVVLRHVVLFAPNLVSGIWLHVLEEGAHGVDLFFIISGFCLSYPALLALHTKNEARFNLAGFFAKRVVRIVPPYWIALGVTVVLAQLLVSSGADIGPTSLSVPSIWDAIRQMVFFDHTDLTNPSFWTLAVEFRWYLLFPVVLWLWTYQRRGFWTIMAGCVVAYQFTLAGGVDMGTLPCFMLGIVAASAEVSRSPLRKWAPALLPVVLTAAVLLEPTRGAAWLGQDQFGWHLAAFLFVLSAGSIAPLRAVMTWAPARAIGAASYSIYLMHQPIMGILMVHDGWQPGPAVAVMVVSCFAFWAAFERTVLVNPVRKSLIDFIAAPIAKILEFIGVPLEFRLHRNAPNRADGEA